LAIRPEPKINLDQVRRNKPKTVKIFIGKIVKSRNSCVVKVGGVGVEGMMMLEEKKLEHMCETGGSASMYTFTAANVRFEGATACDRPLRPHLHF